MRRGTWWSCGMMKSRRMFRSLHNSVWHGSEGCGHGDKLKMKLNSLRKAGSRVEAAPTPCTFFCVLLHSPSSLSALDEANSFLPIASPSVSLNNPLFPVILQWKYWVDKESLNIFPDKGSWTQSGFISQPLWIRANSNGFPADNKIPWRTRTMPKSGHGAAACEPTSRVSVRAARRKHELRGAWQQDWKGMGWSRTIKWEQICDMRARLPPKQHLVEFHLESIHRFGRNSMMFQTAVFSRG